MALLSKKEFAEVCGIKTKDLSVYLRPDRRKVILNKDGLIDTNDEINKSFLEKRRGKNTDAAPSPPIVPIKNESISENQSEIDENTDINTIISRPNQTFTESERQLKYFDILKRRAEIEKLKLDNSKKRGEVVPSDLIQPVFLQHNQSILTEFTNSVDEIVRIFSKRKSLSVNEIAEIKGDLINCINEAMDKSIIASAKSVESIVQAHADKKGIGQRN